MDISLLSPDCLKIKGKNSSIIVDPQTLRQKVAADTVLLLGKNDFDPSKIEGARVVIEGPGEYEISGMKISAFGEGGELVCEIWVDGVKLLLGRVEGVEKAKDKIKENDVAILQVDSKSDQSLLAQVSPKIALFYGEKAKEIVSADFQAEPVSKVTIKADHLPEEMQVMVLST